MTDAQLLALALTLILSSVGILIVLVVIPAVTRPRYTRDVARHPHRNRDAGRHRDY